MNRVNVFRNLALIGGGCLALCQVSLATENVAIVPHAFDLTPGQVLNIPLDPHKRTERLYISAQGIRFNATFEVMVDGVVQGTLHVPGHDPSYVVTLRKRTPSFQLRHVSGGIVRIDQIMAEYATRNAGGYSPDPSDGYDQGSGYGEDCAQHFGSRAYLIGCRVVELVNQFRPYASIRQWSHFLVPLRKSAGILMAKAKVRPISSTTVRALLQKLESDIQAASSFLDEILEQDVHYGIALQFYQVRDEIEFLLQ